MVIKLRTGDEITCKTIVLDGQDILADDFCLVPVEDVDRIEDDEV